MISDSQVYLALSIVMVTALLAIRLGKTLYQ